TERWFTTERIECRLTTVEPGGMAAVRFAVEGMRDDEPVITVEHVTRLTPAAAPDWEFPPDNQPGVHRVVVEGEPRIELNTHVSQPFFDVAEAGCIATAARVINAIDWVCAAPPGLVEAADTPPTSLIRGLMWCLRRAHDRSANVSTPKSRQPGTQFAFEDLAVAALGQLVDELVALRPLEPRDTVQQMRVELLGGGRPDDERHHDLAPLRIRRAHHTRLGDTGMLDEHFLDLTGVDVAAPADHHVLGAVPQGEVAAVVERAHVAGVEPAVAQRVRGRGGIAPVARHHHIAAAHDLPDLADGGRPAVGSQHRDLHSGPGMADRSEHRVFGHGAGLVEMVRAPQTGDRHRRLALPVELYEHRAERRQRLLEALDVHRPAAVDDG